MTTPQFVINLADEAMEEIDPTHMMDPEEARSFYREVMSRCRARVNALTADIGDAETYGEMAMGRVIVRSMKSTRSIVEET